jgi:truncated hemoglobin YjbI
MAALYENGGRFMKLGTIYAAVFVAAGIVVVACAAKKPPPPEAPHVETVSDAGSDADAEPPKEKSLYERLGKQEGITKVVDAFTKHLQADPKFNKRLATLKGPKLDKFKKDMVDLICVESGGPEAGAECKYEGRFMKEALGAKSKLKEEEWQAMLVDLRTSLEENGIHNDEQQDVAFALVKFREDAVEAAKKPKK